MKLNRILLLLNIFFIAHESLFASSPKDENSELTNHTNILTLPSEDISNTYDLFSQETPSSLEKFSEEDLELQRQNCLPQIPGEILELILLQLPLKDFARSANVCKRFYYLTTDSRTVLNYLTNLPQDFPQLWSSKQISRSLIEHLMQDTNNQIVQQFPNVFLTIPQPPILAFQLPQIDIPQIDINNFLIPAPQNEKTEPTTEEKQ